MKKGKKIIAKILSDGTVMIEAYCLATDSWSDFRYFLKAAQENIERRANRDANRHLRAALLCLFAHLEGTVGQVFMEHSNEIEGADEARILSDKTKALTKEAKKHASVPDLNFRLGKYFRDIIAHPGIEKTFGGKTVDETTVFEELTVETVSELGTKIDAWLDCICSIFKVTRFTDTKAMVERFAEPLGTVLESGEE